MCEFNKNGERTNATPGCHAHWFDKACTDRKRNGKFVVVSVCYGTDCSPMAGGSAGHHHELKRGVAAKAFFEPTESAEEFLSKL